MRRTLTALALAGALSCVAAAQGDSGRAAAQRQILLSLTRILSAEAIPLSRNAHCTTLAFLSPHPFPQVRRLLPAYQQLLNRNRKSSVYRAVWPRVIDVQVQPDLQTSAGVALRFGPSPLDTARFSMFTQGDRTVLCLNVSP